MQEMKLNLKNELNDEEYTYLKNTLFKEAANERANESLFRDK